MFVKSYIGNRCLKCKPHRQSEGERLTITNFKEWLTVSKTNSRPIIFTANLITLLNVTNLLLNLMVWCRKSPSDTSFSSEKILEDKSHEYNYYIYYIYSLEYMEGIIQVSQKIFWPYMTVYMPVCYVLMIFRQKKIR